MNSYEENASAFDKIYLEIDKNFDPTFSEADTRIKIIDRILGESLGWAEKDIRREPHVHEGYIDYVLQSSDKFLIIEAKRVDKTFCLSAAFTFEKHLSVKNLLEKQADLKLMYDQVTKYALESGIQFCLLTNGTQWIIFPGVRTDHIHIRNSKVIVFNGLGNIKSHFLDFWRLLSFDSVGKGELSKILLDQILPIEPSFIFNSEGRVNVPFDRNPLSACLIDVLPKYFGDLYGDPTKTEMLKECFVNDNPVQESIVESDLKAHDETPSTTISSEPIRHFYSLPQASQHLEAVINSFLSNNRDKFVQVLLGRVGIGKTTFLANFFDLQKIELSEKQFILRLDFQNISDSTDLESFFVEHLWEMITKHPRFSALMTPDSIRKIFKDDIRAFSAGPVSLLSKSEDREVEVIKHISNLYSDRHFFLKKIASFLYKENFARFILVFDNVDQLDLELQEKVIRFAYAKTIDYHAFAIIIMWEETYYSAKRSGKVLSTIRTVPLQLTRQSTAVVLIKRLNYLISQIKTGKERLDLLNPKICSKNDFCRFLDLILRSLLVDNKNVRLFLELIALGNIRAALETFHSFLTAGSLDTKKIIEIMQKDDQYLVPVHEFIKSVMLGSKRYYSERTSDILNLFAIGDIERPSHFTRIRLLQWLYERRHESTLFGRGFRLIKEAEYYFGRIGASKKDISTSFVRLNDSGLIENDLHARKYIEHSQAIRITATGRYYLSDLYRMFSYVDLVMQDTPFFDQEAFALIEKDCESTDLEVRFRRVQTFISYLEAQEEEELLTIEKLANDITWRKRFVPNMKTTFEKTKGKILSKVMHNKV